MVNQQEYIDSLRWRYSSLTNEIIELRKQIQDIFSVIDNKQMQVQNLYLLLKAEGEKIETTEGISLTSGAIAEIVYNFMSEQESNMPLHYTDITNKIMAKGVLIPGKNPASNLLSNINRDDRFIRTAPGTYGLKEWGVKPMASRKRKSHSKKSNYKEGT